MSVLVLELTGPMQSWGCQDAFDDRGTLAEPTKSGVIGLLAAALGRERGESIDDLTSLCMAVRVEREGIALHDFQTAGCGKFNGELYGVYRSDGSNLTKSNAEKRGVTRRKVYLFDAAFLVFLESDRPDAREFLEILLKAVRNPRWPLSLGRRCCPPVTQIGIEVIDKSLEDAIRTYPCVVNDPQPNLRVVEESKTDEGDIQSDHPLSFKERSFRYRYTKTYIIPCSVEL